MYGNSFSWHGYANYLKLAINPETGEAFPDNTNFSVTASIPGYDDSAYHPKFDNYDWTATRWGGASGITVNLPADYAN